MRTTVDGHPLTAVKVYSRKERIPRISMIVHNERWSHPESQPITELPCFDPTVHSKTGVIPVRVHDFPQGINDYVVKASQELPNEFSYNPDHNSGNVHGVAWLHTMTTNGERATSSLYLSPDVLARPNLHVLLNAQVTRLIQTKDNNGVPSFRSVEFVQNIEGSRHVVTASKEVILSAGSIGSPHILLNSGMGNKQELESAGVTPTFHLPDVGKNIAASLSAGMKRFQSRSLSE